MKRNKTRPITAEGILTQAAETIRQRGKDYDRPSGKERSMQATVAAFNAIRGKGLTTSDGWAFMVLLKMVRAAHSPGKGDSALDGTAYFALLGEEDSEAVAG